MAEAPLESVSVDLQEILSQAGLSPKILVVPSPQAGRKILAAWARKGLPSIGIRAYTPSALAEAVLGEAFPDRSLNRLSDMNQVLGLDSVLRSFEFRKLEALGWSGRQLARSIQEMRLAGLSPAEYKQATGSRLGREVSQIFDAYVKWLYGEGGIDETERFVRADMALGRTNAPAVLAVMAETPVSEAAREFLEALAGRVGQAVVVSDGRVFESGAAGQVLADWKRAVPPPSPKAEVDLVRLSVVEDEARFAFEEVARRGLPLDSVEIAYPRHTPYLPMALAEARRLGVPATSAAGVPLSDLPVGQGVRLFLEWLASGQDSTELTRLLRSGFVKLPDSVQPGRVVALLVEMHVVGDRKDYRRAFRPLRQEAQDELEQARGTDRERGANARLKRLRAAERAVDRLFDYVPGPEDSLRTFATRLRRFVEALIPEPEVPESAAGKGRAELLSRLAQIEEGPDSTHPSLHLVGRFREWIPTVIVHARVDAPGSVHIVPLESAGFTGRPHLFVLGLDTGSFLPSPVEDVFLPDDFCEAYEKLSGPLTSEARVERRRHALHRALDRAGQTATVVVAEGRIADDSDSGPASTFIELESRYGSARKVRMAPVAGASGLVLQNRQTPIGLRLLGRHFPSMERGRSAMEARASDVFTPYDGFVGARASVDRVLGAPLSASKLQVLATCPFKFFQAHVLGVPRLEERKPGQWMTPLENGSLVHAALNEFNAAVMAGSMDARDREGLETILVNAFKAFRKGNEPPSEFAWRSKLKELSRVAQVVTSVDREVVAAELGFGTAPWRVESEADHTGDFHLDLGESGLLIRGRIDAVERTAQGLVITDYKTGNSKDYDEADLLDKGRRLQWVLYAYAYEQISGETVEASGYLFVSGDTAGRTAYGRPPSRAEIGAMLNAQFGLARRGAFGASVNPGGACKWCEFKRVCGDLGQRRGEMTRKLTGLTGGEAGGDGQAVGEATDLVAGWSYGEKITGRGKA
ncbi:MAG: hypothetical protein HKN29_05215 [Rhodothermales bacterium]|nr:hypothetical protein [Rhodothermales bacterium]